MGGEYFQLEVVHQTEVAVLVSDGGRQCWLPKSQIEFDDSADDGDVTTFCVPEWLAIERGLV